MANADGYAVGVTPSQYPEMPVHRTYGCLESEVSGAAVAFYPLHKFTRDSVLDGAQVRVGAIATANPCNLKLGYKVDGSATVVDLTTNVDLHAVVANTLTTLPLVTVPTTSSGMAPVIPADAIMGYVLSADPAGIVVMSISTSTRENQG